MITTCSRFIGVQSRQLVDAAQNVLVPQRAQTSAQQPALSIPNLQRSARNTIHQAHALPITLSALMLQGCSTQEIVLEVLTAAVVAGAIGYKKLVANKPEGHFIRRCDSSLPGSTHNEDASGCYDNLAWMIDGATPIGNYPLLKKDARSNAAWLAQTAAGGFALSATRDDLTGAPLGQYVEEAVQYLQRAAERDFVCTSVPLHKLPSAALALARLQRFHLDIFCLADIDVFVDVPGKPTLTFTDHRFQAFERTAINLVTQCHREGITNPQEVLLRINEMRRENQKRINQPGGLWVLSLDPRVAKFGVNHRVRVKPRTRVLMASDGFSRLVHLFKAYTPAGLVEAVAQRGGNALISELRDLEQDDADCTKYPRVKRHDDASALLLEIP